MQIFKSKTFIKDLWTSNNNRTKPVTGTRENESELVCRASASNIARHVIISIDGVLKQKEEEEIYQKPSGFSNLPQISVSRYQILFFGVPEESLVNYEQNMQENIHTAHEQKMVDICCSKRKRWRKILYEDQNVPDNYVDSSFLDELKRNLHTRKYDYWTVCQQSGEVTQQISSLGLFVVAYVYMEKGWLSPYTLFTIAITLTLAGYMLKMYIDHWYQLRTSTRTFLDDLKTALVFAGFSYGLSPVLVSLTETVSTDTIYAMTTMMLLGNLVFHHYGANAALVSEALSLNAGLFASVCLASRLHTTWHSFTTVTISIEIFGLWPMLRRNLRKHIPQTQNWLTLLLVTLTSLLLWTFSTVAAMLYIILCLFITFICPAWLVSLQPYKNNIHGPWDEAVVEEKKIG